MAYAITTPFENGADAEVRQGDTIIRAAAQAGLPWLILASVAAADRAAVPHFQQQGTDRGAAPGRVGPVDGGRAQLLL